MENYGHTRTQETQKRLKLSLHKKEDHNHWDYCFEKDDNSISIYDKDHKLVVQIPTRSNDEQFVFQYFSNLIHRNHSQLKKVERLVGSIQRQKKSLERNFLKADKIIADNSDDSINDTLVRNHVQTITKSVITLSDFTRQFVESKIFRNYNSCQVLIHEKGTAHITSYSYDSINKSQISQYDVSDFNKLFARIKKSKKRIFDTAKNSNNSLEVLGKYLGNVCELTTHNVIILLSGGSFFPPSKYEINLFTHITDLLRPYIKSMVHKEQIETRVFYEYLCLNYYPAGIRLFNSEGANMFTNKAYEIHPYQEVLKQIELAKNNVMIIHESDRDEIITDFNHFERIQLLGNLLNTLGHELSNPIFGMKLACDLLITEVEDDDEVKELLCDISNNLKRSQSILQNFSDLYTDELQIVNLKELIAETMTIAKSAIKQVKKEFHFYSSIHHMKTNPTWLSQILFNLLINAADAMNEASIDLKDQLITIEVFNSNNLIEIKLSDNGPGISEVLAERIFHPFYTTKERGTGLGLMICHNLAEKLGGNIELINPGKKGATFSLRLPIKNESIDN